MTKYHLGFTVLAATVAALSSAMLPSRAAAATPKVGFSEDVMPIFRGYCVSCHQPGGEGYARSGLDLRSYQGVMHGTKFGPMIIPGHPESSNLMWLLDWNAAPGLRMPYHHKELSPCERDTIRTWIFEGAHDN